MRRVLTALILLATAAATAGTVTAVAQSGTSRTVVRVAISGDENNLSPYGITFASGKTEDLIALVYDSLWASSSVINPAPLLAKSATTSRDGKIWTVKIRSGVKWQDGVPLTAKDVKFTYEYFFKTENGLYSHHVNDQPYVSKIALVGPSTVRFTCRSACPTFNIDPGGHIPIIPEHIWKNIANPMTDPRAVKDLPIGSGPYRVVKHTPDQLYRLKANPNYFEGKPLVDEIDMPIIKDTSAMFLALRSGQIDAASPPAPPEALSGLEAAGLKVVDMTDYNSNQIFLNNQRYPFTLRGFRKALNLATDTASITHTLLGAKGKPGVESFLAPDSPYVNPSLHHVYDPHKAMRLLDRLNFKGNGIRKTPNGKPLDFELLVPSGDASAVRAGELLAAQLMKVGVKLKVSPVDSATLTARRKPQDAAKRVPFTTKTGNYDMYFGAFTHLFHFHADPDGLLYVFHCPGRTGFGAYESGYCDRRFDALVDRATTLPAAQRKPLFQQAQQILFDDPPIIGLSFPDGLYPYNPKAYDRWVQEKGHGIFNRLSFLPGKRTSAATTASRSTSSGSSLTPIILAIVVVVLLAGGALAFFRRRKSASGAESSGPEVD